MKTFKMIDPNLIRLYRYFMPYKWRLGFACVFLMGSASMSSITATLLGKMADLGFYQQESWMIYAAPVALIAVTVGFAFCTVMSAYLMAQVSQSVLLTMRGLLFEHILHWPESEFQKHTSGRMSSKFVNEAASALSGAVGSFTVLVRDSVQVAALLVVLFWQDWKLTLVTFVIIPGLAVTLRFISTRIRKIVGESQELLGGMISRVQETYEAERLVKVSNAYDFEERRFADVNDGIRRLSLKSLKLSAVTTPVTQILTLVAIACVVGVALYQAQHGMLTIGEFVTFLSALLLIKAPIQHLSGLSGTFAGISVAAESIFETLDSPVETEGTEELRDRSGRGTHRVRARRRPLSRQGRSRRQGLQPHGQAGRVHRGRGPVGLGKDDPHQSSAALPRARVGPRHDRRARHPRLQARQPAKPHRLRYSGRRDLRRHAEEQSDLRP